MVLKFFSSLKQHCDVRSLCLVTIVALSALINLASFRDGHRWGDDFALYLEQAGALKNHDLSDLASKQAFLYHNSKANELEALGPSFYPWGFPLILAPMLAVFGLNIVALKTCVFGFALISLFVGWHLFKGLLDAPLLLMLIGFVGLNPFFTKFKDDIMSDFPFLFFALLSMLFIQRLIVQQPLKFHKTSHQLLLGIVMFGAFSVRTIGIVLPMVMAASLMLKIATEGIFKPSQWVIAFKGTVVIWLTLFTLGLIYWFLFPSASYSASYSLKRSLQGVPGNIYYYMSEAVRFSPAESLGKYILIFTVPVTVYGMLKSFKTASHYLFYFFFSSVILTLWPFQADRFLLNLLPFYFFFFLRGGSELPILRPVSPARYAGVLNPVFLASALIVILCLVVDLNYLRQVRSGELAPLDGPFLPESQQMVQFAIAHTGGDDVLVFRKPRALRLLSGRMTVICDNLDQLKKLHAKYHLLVIIDKVDAGWQLPSVDSAVFQRVFQNSRFDIYEMN